MIFRGAELVPSKKTEGAGRRFLKGSIRVTKILFCGRGSKCYSLPRGTNSNTVHQLLSYLFLSNTIEDRCGAFEAEPSRSGYEEHPRHFCMGVGLGILYESLKFCWWK